MGLTRVDRGRHRTRRLFMVLVMLFTATAAGGTTAAGTAAARPASGLVGLWSLHAGTGRTAVDTASAAEPLALKSGAGWAGRAVGSPALRLDGDGQYAQVSGPVLPTSGSFTVSARVWLASTAGDQSFVSQDGRAVSGFRLQLRDGRFTFAVPNADAAASPTAIASDRAVIPQPEEWYELVGVHNATAHTISLYVDGALAATVPTAAAWSAGGDFAVGRSLDDGAPDDFVHGAINDVRAYAAPLAPPAIAQLAGRGRIVVEGRRRGATIRPTQFGEFVEEISHAVDGGLYAELIRNRDLKQNDRTPSRNGQRPAAWSAVGAAASLSLSHADPLTKANPLSLQLSVAKGAATGVAGVANGGWWGFPVRPSTTYRVSCYIRATGAGTQAPLTVALRSNSGRIWAAASLGTPGTTWRRVTATLTTPASVVPSLENHFVISTPAGEAAGGTDWFALVSVFPPTYDGLANGFRIDLMDRLAALRPGFLRIPGGNYVEGRTIATRFNWQQTIGPIKDRPGHFDSAFTGYWSQDGMGLLEYLELAQELHARPILVVWDGYSIDGSVVPQSRLAPYVRSAVDEIQYATGSTSTYWGHQRAVDGHPKPFPVHMVEIGNEDYFDTSGSYNSYRYPAFYDAIHGAYPKIRMIASEPVTSRPVFAVDKHLYRPKPYRFLAFAHLFDSLSPSGPKVFVSEYGSQDAMPTANLGAAVAEAAFLTGTIRDAGVVLGVSYAPSLVNVNAPQWPSSLIAFDGLRNYVSPSYRVLQMLRDNLGRRVVATRVIGGTGTLFDVATESPGHTYLVVVNSGTTAADMQVALTGLGGGAVGGTATVLSGPPTARNSFAHPNRVAPRSAALPASLGTGFADRFPADSVTVLDLSTPARTHGG
jgi:alpha-L-arabinofuranosidase